MGEEGVGRGAHVSAPARCENGGERMMMLQWWRVMEFGFSRRRQTWGMVQFDIDDVERRWSTKVEEGERKLECATVDGGRLGRRMTYEAAVLEEERREEDDEGD